MKYNKILEKVNSNESAVGLNLPLYSPHLIEFFGSLGFDWVFIDCEHGSMTDSEAENMIRAAELYGMAPVVRVPGNEPHIILKMLDAGAKGIVVPHIDNVEDAIKARDAAKYPPLGKRGSNYGTGRNNNYGSLNFNNLKNPKNIIFKIHNNTTNNNNGAVCDTKTKTDILTIINNIDKNVIKDKMNKESLCQYLAYLYYINNNLKIVPYKKMIN